MNKPLGTVSNENGEFSLNINNYYIQDTLKISCLGYKSKEFLIKDLLNGKSNEIKISLEDNTEKLKEITITSRKLKTYTQGKKRINSKNKVYFAIPSIKNLNLGSEIGRKFSLGSRKASILENFQFYLIESNFKNLKFRLNIYSIENKRPGNKLNDSNILVNVDNYFKGWIKVNLIDYNLKIKQDIIITVEWINTSKDGNKLSLPIIIPSISSTHYYKYGAQAKWKKYGGISTPMLLTYKQ
ncbi:MAG: carboxypeptidase-like regulatory domain-containing protein [Flavobacteriaceae bacterium]|nr:carboxypeptidase-like regulatory domain-containing protein [Flavobacteriaceae bacterium]